MGQAEPLEEPDCQRKQREADAPIEATLARMGVRPQSTAPAQMLDLTGLGKLGRARTRRRLVGERIEGLQTAEREARDGTGRKRKAWDEKQARIYARWDSSLHENAVRHQQADVEAGDRRDQEIAALGPRP